MDTDKHRLSDRNSLAKFNTLTERVIGWAFQVRTTLGGGLLEKVYENALAHELDKAGLLVQQPVPIRVTYAASHASRLAESHYDLSYPCSSMVPQQVHPC